MRKLLLSVLFCLLAGGIAYCGEASDILLDDGSMIRGEVVSLMNGKYTVKSDVMGTLTLDAGRVRQISRGQVSGGTAAFPRTPQASGALKEKVEEARTLIMNDPEAMRGAAALAQDPAFLELMSDPQIVAAMNSGDTAALMNNPRFKAFADNPQVRGMAERLKDNSQ